MDNLLQRVDLHIGHSVGDTAVVIPAYLIREFRKAYVRSLIELDMTERSDSNVELYDRLLFMRDLMREVDWYHAVQDHPHIKEWFKYER